MQGLWRLLLAQAPGGGLSALDQPQCLGETKQVSPSYVIAAQSGALPLPGSLVAIIGRLLLISQGHCTVPAPLCPVALPLAQQAPRRGSGAIWRLSTLGGRRRVGTA